MKSITKFKMLLLFAAVMILRVSVPVRAAEVEECNPVVPYVLDFPMVYVDGDQSEDLYESTVYNILSGIDPSWSDEKKLLYIHDYIVTNCQYDQTYNNYSAYDCLVEHSAVCNGYALAFCDLANRLGIETHMVASDKLWHAWNVSVLNGKHYYIDCTWDDPVYSGGGHFYEMYCKHTNFLRSRDGMTETSHDSTDWEVYDPSDSYYEYEPVYSRYNDKEYDSAAWHDIESPFVITNDYILTLDEDTFYYYNSLKNDPVRTDKAEGVSFVWSVFNGGGYRWRGSFATTVSAGGLVYFNNSESIFSYDPSTEEITEVLYISDEDKSVGYIYGIRAEGNGIKYYISPDYVAENCARTGVYALPSSATSISLSQSEFYVFRGNEYTLTASVGPDTAIDKSVVWSSSDPSIATVDQNGVVRGIKEGKAIITATAVGGNGIYATCLAKVFPTIEEFNPPAGCAFQLRLYNPNSGEHFYTGSSEETMRLINAGWDFEGSGFITPTTGVPIYRLYSEEHGDHFYTTDESERDSLIAQDWTYEGVAFPSATKESGGREMYRLLNPNAYPSGKAGAHHFTMSWEEVQNLVNQGWTYEKVAWYSV